MDVIVTGRHQQLSDRFRDHVHDRLTKVEQLAPRAMRVDVIVSHEPAKRSSASERVEITIHVKGPVIRAEACHDDKYVAFDQAMEKLLERLRRANDRRRVARGRHPGAESLSTKPAVIPAPAPVSQNGSSPAPPEPDLFGAVGDSPIEVREKVHATAPMTLEQALAEMELVGHDFFLFHDSDTDKPSVVYRRRGWRYGVIHLEVAAS